ncbi:EA22-like protein [Escherichia coli]|nr:EA22-like protein [Escherichia coli]
MLNSSPQPIPLPSWRCWMSWKETSNTSNAATQENEEIALTVGKLRVELEAEKQRAKDLFMENARLKSGIAGLIHLGIRYADVES